MEFGNGKCAVQIIKSGKKESAEEIRKRKNPWREGKKYKYNGILNANTLKQGEMEKMGEVYLRRIFSEPFCYGNLIKRKNILSVALVRFSEPFFKWTREELRKIDQRIRKRTTGDYIDRLQMSRKEGRRGIVRIENCVDTSIKGLDDYVNKRA